MDWSRRADSFAYRQFDDKSYLGTQIRFDKHEFEKKINEIYRSRNKELVDGCASFVRSAGQTVIRLLGAHTD